MAAPKLVLPDLRQYDIITVNTSSGKDSQCAMDVVMKAADAAQVKDRVVAVNCDLGAAEWRGSAELALRQARHYGLRTYTVRREHDLLYQVEHERQKWPAPGIARYCTSDHKTHQVWALHTHLANALRPRLGGRRQVRILDVLGVRAEESRPRALANPFDTESRASSGNKLVHRLYPIHNYRVGDVWDTIKASGVPHHPAYDLGMPRLSCVFCIFASKDALVVAGLHNPELLEEYVRIEATIGHRFKNDLSIADVQRLIATGYVPKCVASWCM